jgi:hypothetical protein
VEEEVSVMTPNRLQQELDNYESGEYLHPDDVAGNVRRIVALNLIIADFSAE